MYTPELPARLLGPIDPDAEPRAVTGWTIMATIFGFWLFYTLLVTLRSWLLDFPAQGEMALRRAAVTAIGMVLTVVLWQILKRFDRKPLSARMTAAAVFAIPIAFAITWANYSIFYDLDQAMLNDLQDLPELEKYRSFAAEMLEMTISRYFFLIGWSGLYIALGFVDDVQRAERQAAQFARAAQFAELRALRYQVNPHFLFNALNSLSALVMVGRKTESEAFIMNLASFYRASLAGNVMEDVPLREELDMQRLYLDIEAVRFADRLLTEFDVPDALLDRMVPGMILQPLVENAIKHGVSVTSQPVAIRIEARAEPAGMRLTVSNTLPSRSGVEPSGSAKPGRNVGTGIGLANVRERLEARFGAAAQLTVNDQAADMFSVSLLLPGAIDA